MRIATISFMFFMFLTGLAVAEDKLPSQESENARSEQVEPAQSKTETKREDISLSRSLAQIWDYLNNISINLLILILAVLFMKPIAVLLVRIKEIEKWGIKFADHIQNKSILLFGKDNSHTIVPVKLKSANIKRSPWKRFLLIYHPFGLGGHMRHGCFWLYLVWSIYLLCTITTVKYYSVKSVILNLGLIIGITISVYVLETIIDKRYLSQIAKLRSDRQNPIRVGRRRFIERALLAYKPSSFVGWIFHLLYYAFLIFFNFLWHIVFGGLGAMHNISPEANHAKLVAGLLAWSALGPAFVIILNSLAATVDGEPKLYQLSQET